MNICYFDCQKSEKSVEVYIPKTRFRKEHLRSQKIAAGHLKIKYSRYNNRRVRTLESDPEVTVRRLGKIIQGFFLLLNQEPAFAEPLGNGLERLVSQGLLFFYRKLSPLQFLPGTLRFASSNRGCRLIQLIERTAPCNTELRNFRSQIVIYCKLNKLSLITFIVCVVFCNVMGFLGPLIFHLLPIPHSQQELEQRQARN